MGVVLDSSVLIAAERGALNLDAMLAALPPGETTVTTAIVAAELLHGVERAHPEARRARRSAFVEALLGRLTLLPVDLGTARLYARIWATLAAAGQPIGPHDMLIAAVALQHRHAVATCNARHFRRVPGLEILDWSAPLP